MTKDLKRVNKLKKLPPKPVPKCVRGLKMKYYPLITSQNNNPIVLPLLETSN